MANEYEGVLDAKGLKFAVVLSRFNSFIGEKLLEGAIDAIKRHGGDENLIDIVRVPGAFEIPLAAKKMAAKKGIDAVICLGAVIRGGTPHFDYVASEVSKGVATVSLDSGLPVSFGVITTDNLEQAIERSGSKAGNKGFDAAVSAIEMSNLLKTI